MATERQKKLAKNLVENALSDKPLTKQEIVVKSGYSEVTADRQVPVVIEAKGVQEEIKNIVDAMKVKGVTPEKLADKINVLLDARKLITKNNMTTGEVDIVREEPDYQAIDKGITQAMKIGVGGGYQAEKSIQVQVKGDIKDYAKYKGIKEKFEQELLNDYQDET